MAVAGRLVAAVGGAERGVHILELLDAAGILPRLLLEAFLLFLELGGVLLGDLSPRRVEPRLVLLVLVSPPPGEALISLLDVTLVAGHLLLVPAHGLGKVQLASLQPLAFAVQV